MHLVCYTTNFFFLGLLLSPLSPPPPPPFTFCFGKRRSSLPFYLSVSISLELLDTYPTLLCVKFLGEDIYMLRYSAPVSRALTHTCMMRIWNNSTKMIIVYHYLFPRLNFYCLGEWTQFVLRRVLFLLFPSPVHFTFKVLITTTPGYLKIARNICTYNGRKSTPILQCTINTY